MTNANGRTGDNEFDTAVLSAAAVGGVIRDWVALAISFCGYIRVRYALRHQILANTVGALLREVLVVVVGSDVIGITLHLHFQIGISKQDS